MKAIISPAKKMRTDMEGWACTALPAYLSRSETLLAWIRELSYPEQKALWACSDRIARENAQRFAEMDLRSGLTPAILAYDGIQYTSMGAAALEDSHIAYLQGCLRILSGFYGVLKPLDGVVPYRLEMQSKATPGSCRSLYDFWGDLLYREVMDEDRTVVNLASAEYARCIEKYLRPGDRFITCVFGEEKNGRVVQKGVYAKMARGDMVRYMAETRADSPEMLREFCVSGYHFDAAKSTETEYVFTRTEIPGKRRGL